MVVESIANALDANASRIKITIEDGIYSIEDDGKGMTKQEFEDNYHSLAFSTKTRGEGIGFAGVGAKLYLIFLETGNKIVTETRSESFHGASELVLMEGEPKWRHVAVLHLDHNGTIYNVQLHKTHKQLLTPDKVMKIVQRHYNAILLGLYGDKIIEVNEIEVPARRVKTDQSASVTFNMQDKLGRVMRYRCQFILSNKEIPDDNRGLDTVVYGKIIKKEWFVPVENIKPDFRRRITGYVLADGLSTLLTTNKADFRPAENPRLWANFRSKVYDAFKKWLQKIGAYQKPTGEAPKSELLMLRKEVEQTLAKIFKEPLIAKYNPFMAKRTSTLAIPTDAGAISIVAGEGAQTTEGSIGGQGEGAGIEVHGPEQGSGIRESSEGKEKGERVPRTVRNSISIGYKNEPDNPSECWFTPEAILINTAHPTFLRCQDLGYTAEKLHLLRCVFMTLIENNPPNTIKEAFDDLRTFYRAWSNA